MGLAALFVGVVAAVTIVITIVYGATVGLVSLGRSLWRFLAVGPTGDGVGAVAKASATLPCFQEKDCPPSVREECPVYLQWDEDLPCWLTALRAENRLRPSCLTCSRFKVTDLVAKRRQEGPS